MATQKLRSMPGVKRTADGILAPLDLIRFTPGWNVRQEGDDLTGHIEVLKNSIMGGATIPPLHVRIVGDHLEVVDGHCRTRALRLARDQGLEVDLVPIIEFIGNDADRISLMFTSAQGKSLTSYEQAVAFKRLQTLKWSIADISKRVGRSVGFVDSMLKLANADTDVQELVATGQVAASAAVTVVRKAGSKAGAVLREKVKKVNANVVNGAKAVKVTDTHVDGGLSRATQKAVVAFFTELETHLGGDTLTEASQHITADANALDAAVIDVSLLGVVNLIRLRNQIINQSE